MVTPVSGPLAAISSRAIAAVPAPHRRTALLETTGVATIQGYKPSRPEARNTYMNHYSIKLRPTTTQLARGAGTSVVRRSVAEAEDAGGVVVEERAGRGFVQTEAVEFR
jgi:hypothetical protein